MEGAGPGLPASGSTAAKRGPASIDKSTDLAPNARLPMLVWGNYLFRVRLTLSKRLPLLLNRASCGQRRVLSTSNDAVVVALMRSALGVDFGLS